MMAYRSTVNASTGKTPNQMVFGRNIVLPLQAYIGLPPEPATTHGSDVSPSDYVTDLKDQLETIHSQALKILKNKTEYRKQHYDLTAKKRTFEPGDPVWLHDKQRRPGICNKLSVNWKGPYLIVKKIDDLVYLVKRSLKLPAKAVHIDRLVKYNSMNIPKWFAAYMNDKKN